MRKYIPENLSTIPQEAERVFEGEIFDVYHWQQSMFDNTTQTFEMLRRPDTVNIIAIRDDKLVITRQRQPRKDWFFSLAGGRVDDEDADELAAAKREMLEETGMTFKNWKLISAKQPFGKIEWVVYTFVATDFIEQVRPEPDAGEEIEIMRVDFDKIKELFASGVDCSRIQDLRRFSSIDEILNAPALFRYDS